ncbi:MAG: RNA polymerase factor sigma-54 [Xanthobacteraceae bacterium]
MALSQRLEFRQTQALVMTPQLMQAIKLLQLSSLDLAAYVEGELERNPLLERANDDDEAPVGAAEPEGSASESAEGGEGGEEAAATSDWIGQDMETSRSSMEEGLGTELENVFPDDGGEKTSQPEMPPPAYSEWSGVRAGREDSEYNLEAFVEAETTLRGHLSEQLAIAVADPRQRFIGEYLIDLVDETGYLTTDITEVAEKLGAPLADIEAVLSKLQTFSPTGVGARNLRECLTIQLKDRDRFDPAMRALVGHLEMLAKREFAALKKLCGVDDEDFADMVNEIRALDPKPGLAFGTTLVQPVVPDVFVKQGANGDWIVELNSDTLPKVLVSQTYYAEVSKVAKASGDKTFLAECLQSANWLVRALDQRARTILKVSSEIVRQQDAFLLHGVQHLKPLNLKTIADVIGMHESTVSRVTANKYMATSRGVFELKYFFTSSISSSDGSEAHSAEAVRHRIKQLIDAESPSDVLSDDTIVDKLKEAGIDIARRTVAKYREAMRIASSVQRRREKQTMAETN